MKKRILILTLLLAVGAFALAGCSRKNVQNSSSATKTNKTQTETKTGTENQSSTSQNSDTENQSSTSQNSDTENQSDSALNSDSDNQSITLITEEEARRLALERVPDATENDIRIHLEWDDGIQVYDGEITCNQKEYDFEINADTGEFLEWSEDTAD